MSQTEDHPGSRLRQKCVGGVMDGELSQQRSAAGLRRASAGHLAAVSAPFFSLLSLLPEPWASKARRDDSRCETSHSWAEWAFVSWLITADSWLPTPPLPPTSLTLTLFSPSPSSVCSALSCCSLVKKKKKKYHDDRRRLLNLSLGKKTLCALGCPCRARLPKNIINASAGKQKQQWPGIRSKCVWENNSEFLFFAFFFKAAPTLKPSGSNYRIKMLVHLSCKRLNLCGHDAMFNKVSTLDKWRAWKLMGWGQFDGFVFQRKWSNFKGVALKSCRSLLSFYFLGYFFTPFILEKKNNYCAQ